jgi:hypothetical protein
MMGSKLLENYKFPETINSEMAPNGSCEVVGPKLFEGSSGRKCQADGLECFGFSDPKLYCSCPTRKEASRKRG